MSRGNRKAEQTLTQVMAKLLEKELVPDLKARARMPGVEPVLRQRWEKERSARRTADAYEIWVGHTAEQVGAAWVLSIAFIRTLEDRGLLDRRRLTGHEGYDSEHGFFKLYPALGPRDYLLTVLKELSRLPGAEDLLGSKHNPAWRLAPSNAAAQKLLEAWRQDDEARTPLWTFEGADTRFLGDLYQDLSADVRERYALLQTPDFVERFILKLTLDPAVEEFGLDEVRLIDPTCGSGHFLLGAYDRLFDLKQAREPGVDRRAHALAALAQVHGVDLNPYAVAIARFRLTLAFLEKAGTARLKDAPRLPLNLAVADSLLVAAKGAALHLARGAESKEGWGYDLFDFEDGEEAERILGKGFHAVVGNPPYITCKDFVLRDEYRKLYRSCYREYALAAPFTERFFQLGVDGGFVGLINANSFMKREFGSRLIEEVLPKLDLSHIVDTSGAFIPGHGTPTVILAGRNRMPVGDTVLAVMGKRGEPSTPAEPEKGLVWSTIAGHGHEVGFENEFASVARAPRATLAKHPWSLGGGGAAELKERLERGAAKLLKDVVDEIGLGAVTREDEVYLLGEAPLRTARIPSEHSRPLVIGESIRDWAIGGDDLAVWPYDPSSLDAAGGPSGDAVRRFLWPWKRQLSDRVAFGKTQLERGLRWFEYSMFFRERFRTPLSIAFAFVATHNHFVLDRGGKVFKQSAPIIKLPEGATEDDHLTLLGYLNSSVACFWMKQVCSPKGMHNGSEANATPFLVRFEFDGTKLGQMPVPAAPSPENKRRLWEFARQVDRAALDRKRLNLLECVSRAQGGEVGAAVAQVLRERAALAALSVAYQEEIDWLAYEAMGLAPGTSIDVDLVAGISLGERPFEVHLARTDPEAVAKGWFRWSESAPTHSIPERLPEPQRAAYVRRLGLIETSQELRLLERPENKRRWVQPSGKAAQELQTDEKVLRDEAEVWLRDRIEARMRDQVAPLSARRVAEAVAAEPVVRQVAHWWSGDSDAEQILLDLIDSDAVPFGAPLWFTDSGLEKRGLWERTWDLQRREDAGEKLDAPIPVPPKYDQKDYRDPTFWRLRGKLDVPKERFISYPGAERDDDKSPVIGWAGWDHLQRAQALAALYQERKEEAWTKERLAPLLAGLLELVPWLKQWHNEPNAAFGGQRLGDYFEQYVESESREQGLTLNDLRAWRPPARGKRGKKA